MIGNNGLNKLLSRLKELEIQLKSQEDESQAEYYTVKKEWEDLCLKKIQGMILRSKAKYVDEVEKKFKIFPKYGEAELQQYTYEFNHEYRGLDKKT